jgi:hypothetical protein
MRMSHTFAQISLTSCRRVFEALLVMLAGAG